MYEHSTANVAVRRKRSITRGAVKEGKTIYMPCMSYTDSHHTGHHAEPGRAHYRGRLAPSPTGYLHLGNAWAFLLAWLAARAERGSLVLRMEDIDPDRSRAAYAAAIVEDLHWLGLDWDEGPDSSQGTKGPHAPYEQSRRTALYEAALATLEAAGHVYPCYCTRKELRTLAGAPHVGDAGAPYPGRCRHLGPAERQSLAAQGRQPALRLRCPEQADDPQGIMVFEDAVYGPQRHSLARCGGDFALRRSDGVLAYQLAVVADDHAMGITHIVRGRDILLSTPRQLWLCHLLGYTPPHYAHIPLLLDAEGERLAKRHQSLGLRGLRQRGVQPEAIVGLLGLLAGCREEALPCRPAELLPHFSLHRLPRRDLRILPHHMDILGMR